MKHVELRMSWPRAIHPGVPLRCFHQRLPLGSLAGQGEGGLDSQTVLPVDRRGAEYAVEGRGAGVEAVQRGMVLIHEGLQILRRPEHGHVPGSISPLCQVELLPVKAVVDESGTLHGRDGWSSSWAPLNDRCLSSEGWSWHLPACLSMLSRSNYRRTNSASYPTNMEQIPSLRTWDRVFCELANDNVCTPCGPSHEPPGVCDALLHLHLQVPYMMSALSASSYSPGDIWTGWSSWS